MNRGPGNKLGAKRAEQFLHLGNYTLTTAYTGCKQFVVVLSSANM